MCIINKEKKKSTSLKHTQLTWEWRNWWLVTSPLTSSCTLWEWGRERKEEGGEEEERKTETYKVTTDKNDKYLPDDDTIEESERTRLRPFDMINGSVYGYSIITIITIFDYHKCKHKLYNLHPLPPLSPTYSPSHYHNTHTLPHTITTHTTHTILNQKPPATHNTTTGWLLCSLIQTYHVHI